MSLYFIQSTFYSLTKMKLTFSLALLTFAAVGVQAATTNCVSGASGKGEGNGFNGWCCKTSDDCIESCKSGVCNGPSRTTSGASSGPSRTTSTSLSTETAAPCKSGVYGLGKGNGFLGYCCKNSDDCIQSCKNGTCNGPAGTIGDVGQACRPGWLGSNSGEGPAGACCIHSDDCDESCVDGRCD